MSRSKVLVMMLLISVLIVTMFVALHVISDMRKELAPKIPFSGAGIVESLKIESDASDIYLRNTYHVTISGERYDIKGNLAEQLSVGMKIEYSGADGWINKLTFEAP